MQAPIFKFGLTRYHLLARKTHMLRPFVVLVSMPPDARNQVGAGARRRRDRVPAVPCGAMAAPRSPPRPAGSAAAPRVRARA